MIVRELQKDSRLSNVALAARVGLSEGAVRRRIDRMLSEGKISFSVFANNEFMGRPLHAMVQIQCEPGTVDRILDEVVAMNELSYVYQCTGQFEIQVVGYFESTDELRAFTNERLGELNGIAEIRTVIILRVGKRNQEWLDDNPAVADAAGED